MSASQQGGGVTSGAGNTGSGGAISSLGGTSTVTTNSNDNSNAAVQAGQNQWGAVLNAGEGSTLNYTGTDYGATAAATAVFGQALQLAQSAAHDSQITGRLFGLAAQDTIKEQGAGALNLITKPFLWAAGIIAVTIVLIFFVSRKGSK